MQREPRIESAAEAEEDPMNHNRMHIYLLGAAVIVAVLVIAKVPFAGILPFGLLVGCALMMFFMMKAMGGMGGMGGHDDHTRRDAEKDLTAKELTAKDLTAKADTSPDGEPVDHRVT
jgi:hypothetical protein